MTTTPTPFNDGASKLVDSDAGTVRPAVLVVDDKPENLTIISTILEPLEVEILTADCGEAALRVLLDRDVAVIVLDVHMPGIDGFETATIIKQRERSKHVPIIFLTALANDREHALSGYQAGAVDYIEKPVEPLVLQAKVSVFAELHSARVEVERQAELLRRAAAREAARQVQQTREREEQRYRDLAEAMPGMVFSLDADGALDYVSPSWRAYLGRELAYEVEDADATWSHVHPVDRLRMRAAWDRAIANPDELVSDRLEMQLRMRRHDGAWLWHDIRCVPRRDPSGRCIGWVGTATEVDATSRIVASQQMLSEAGAMLVSAQEIEDALVRVAELAVESIVDWCSIDVLAETGRVQRRALRVHGDLATTEAAALAELLDVERADSPVRQVVEDPSQRRVLITGEGRVLGQDDDADLACAICVPLVVRGRRIGVLSVASATDGRRFGEPERSFARALATRVASALDGEQQLRRAEERAQASEVLDAIADGVALVDQRGYVLLWNPAAAEITGVDAADIVGRRAVDLLPDWELLAERVPVHEGEASRAGSTTVPLTAADGCSLWISVSAVGFSRGIAYAFRDLTEERAVERMKSDFVATVSHELRTPLASIHGAAVTLTREDIELTPAIHDQLLEIISQQSVQLADIVESVLTASRLESGELEVPEGVADALQVCQDAVSAARTRSERTVTVEADDELPHVAASTGHLRQVVDNLLENAIKYSGDGTEVHLRLHARSGSVTIDVEDHGIGIPAPEQRRIFEKFYRVDAGMVHGVGGTGLGLFIVQELVRRMSGNITLSSSPGTGTTFSVTLPAAPIDAGRD